MGIKNRTQVRKSTLLCVASSLALTSAAALGAQAQEAASEVEPFTLAEGPLAASLVVLANQLGVSVFAADDLVAGKTAGAVSGATTIEDALSQVLAGTGLTYEPQPGGGYLIVPDAAPVAPAEQASNAAPSASTSDPVPLVAETVVVQGKFQQSLIDRIPIPPQELPFTLNVLDREFLDKRNFTRPIEALTTLPNITLSEDRLGTGTPNFKSRGFFANVLIDNRVSNEFRGSGARDDAFVERYEVLKGPASIALGPIAAGGVINAVTKSPQVDPSLDVEFRADHFGSVGAEIDANIGDALGSDSVFFRISGAYRDFQFDAEETKRETFAIRPVVALDLGPDTALKASVSYTETTSNPNAGFPLLSTGEIPSQIDTSTFTGSANGEAEAEDVYYAAEFNHEFLDGLKLTVRGSYQDTSFDYQNTVGLYNYNYADGGPGIGLNDPYVYAYGFAGATEQEATFIDAQLAYQTEFWGQQQDFVIGAAYNDTNFEREFGAFPFIGAILLDNIDEPRIAPTQNPADFSPFSSFESELNSIYAETAIRPTERLTIIGGIRYDDALRINTRRGNSVPFDDGVTTFRLGATYEATEDINVYASFAQSFDSQFGDRRDNSPLPAETSDGFEIGAKGTLFDDVLSFETAFFHSVRQNVAVDDPDNGPTEFFQANIGELTVQGFEFFGSLTPVEGLNVDFAFGITDVEEDDAEILQADEIVEQNASLYAGYELQSGPLQGLSLGGGFRHVGEIGVFDSYTITDLNLSYPIRENIDVSLDVLNVFDEEYVENADSGPGQNFNAGTILGAPTTAVFTIRARY